MKEKLDALVKEAPSNVSRYLELLTPILTLNTLFTQVRGFSFEPYIKQRLATFVTNPYWLGDGFISYTDKEVPPEDCTHLFCFFAAKKDYLQRIFDRCSNLQYLYVPILPKEIKGPSSLKTLHFNYTDGFNDSLFSSVEHLIFASAQSIRVHKSSPMTVTYYDDSTGHIKTAPVRKNIVVNCIHKRGCEPFIPPPLNKDTYKVL